MDINAYITRDPGICGGEPVFTGTRVTLRTVLASLADGDSIAQIVASFPSLKEEQVTSAITFSALDSLLPIRRPARRTHLRS